MFEKKLKESVAELKNVIEECKKNQKKKGEKKK